MRREQIDLSEERQIITNIIMSTDFLREVSTIIRPTFMRSSYAKLICSWVMEYWGEYKEAPGKNIQDIYMQKAKLIQDEEDTELIAEFLTRLNDEADDFQLQNLVYSVNNTIHYLKMQSLHRMKDQIDMYLTENDPTKAEQVIADYTRVEKPEGEGIDLLHDSSKVIQAFMREEETLFTFPGALGKIAGNFSRGGFVAWQGFMKRGKTWWLWYTGQTALFNGCRVLFVSLEMTSDELTQRGWLGMAGSPLKDQEVLIPFFEPVGTKWEISGKTEKRKAIDILAIPEKQKKLQNLVRTGDIRIETFPSYSATVEDIIAHIDNLQYYDHYTPDVVIIDYADIIKPTENRMDYRHQLDSIWKKLRGLAQERNILVVTATQSGRSGASSDIKEDSVAEDIRKLAHVTKMLAINRKKEEAKKGVVRIGQVAERSGPQVFQQAVVLQCLDIGKPYLDSRLESEVIQDKTIED